MKTARLSSVICCLALLLLTALAGCGGGEHAATKASVAPASAGDKGIGTSVVPAPGGAVHGAGVVARVGDQVITKTAFADRMKMEARALSPKAPIVPDPPAYKSCIQKLAALSSGLGAAAVGSAAKKRLKEQCATLFKKLRTQIMKELISATWALKGAREAGIEISDESVRQLLRSKWASAAKFNEFLVRSGENVSDVLWNVKVGIAIAALTKRAAGNVAATPEVVAKYYATHRSSFTVPEERDIGILRVRSLASAHRAKAQLESGTSFQALVRRFKPQPLYLAASGPGLVKGLKRHILHETALDTAIFAAPKRVVSGPVRVHLFPGYHPRFHKNPSDINNIDGYYLFEVFEIRPTHVESLTHVKKALEEGLPRQLEQAGVAAFVKVWRARLRSITRCRPGYVVRKCREYVAVAGEEPEDPYTIN